MDDDGVKFREALYASIHDKVANHIEAAKQSVAHNLIAPLEIAQETQETQESPVENT